MLELGHHLIINQLSCLRHKSLQSMLVRKIIQIVRIRWKSYWYYSIYLHFIALRSLRINRQILAEHLINHTEMHFAWHCEKYTFISWWNLKSAKRRSVKNVSQLSRDLTPFYKKYAHASRWSFYIFRGKVCEQLLLGSKYTFANIKYIIQM